MKPTLELIKEHAQIKLMLKIMEGVEKKINLGDELKSDDIEAILEFLQVFADACHHGKEEKYLFPAVGTLDDNDIKSLANDLMAEHNIGRGLIVKIASAWTSYRQGTIGAGQELNQNLKKYRDLLTEHIRKEDFILFPDFDRQASVEKQAELEAGFAKIEKDIIGPGRHEQFQSLLIRLRSTYI